MTQHKTTRTQLRQTIRDKRRALTVNEQLTAADQLHQRVSVYLQQHKNTKVALYLSNDGELCTLPLIQWCWQQNLNVYLPVIHPFAKGHLLFLRYTPKTKMAKNKFGIAEPKLDITLVCPAADIDVIFTPLVAFDKTGARLGMGGGFYDRTLAQLKALGTNTRIIGLAHDCQCVDQIPLEAWDMPLQQIFTPSCHYKFS